MDIPVLDTTKIIFGMLSTPRKTRDEFFEDGVRRGDLKWVKAMGMLGADASGKLLHQMMHQPTQYTHELIRSMRGIPRRGDYRKYEYQREEGYGEVAGYLAARLDLLNERNEMGDDWVTQAFNGQSALSWLNRPLYMIARKNIVMETLLQGIKANVVPPEPNYNAIFCEVADTRNREFLAATITSLREFVDERLFEPKTATERKIFDTLDKYYNAEFDRKWFYPVEPLHHKNYAFPTPEFVKTPYRGEAQYLVARQANRTALGIV